jgi:hypothetical protein
MLTKIILEWVVPAVLLIVAVALLNGLLPAPTPALEAWTTWLAKVVGILVAARVLWVGATVLESYRKRA